MIKVIGPNKDCLRIREQIPLASNLYEKLEDIPLDETGISKYPVGTIVVIDYPFFDCNKVKRRYAIVVESRKGFSKINDGAALLCIDEDDPLMGATLAGITSSDPGEDKSDFDVTNYQPNSKNKINVVSRIYFGGVYVASDNTSFHATGEEADLETLRDIIKKFTGSVMSGKLEIVFDKELEDQFEQEESEQEKTDTSNDSGSTNERLAEYNFRRRGHLIYRRRLGA